jgi:argininosuccinate lyase
MEIGKEVVNSPFVDTLGSYLIYNRKEMSDDEFINLLTEVIGGSISMASVLVANEFMSEEEIQKITDSLRELQETEKQVAEE